MCSINKNCIIFFFYYNYFNNPRKTIFIGKYIFWSVHYLRFMTIAAKWWVDNFAINNRKQLWSQNHQSVPTPIDIVTLSAYTLTFQWHQKRRKEDLAVFLSNLISVYNNSGANIKLLPLLFRNRNILREERNVPYVVWRLYWQ